MKRLLLLSLMLSAAGRAQPMLREVQPTSGKAGSSVQLLGSGFGQEASAVKVFFGDAPAEVSGVSEGKLTTRVPDDAPKNSALRVEVGSLTSQPQTFTCIPSVRLTVAKNPLESGEHTRGRFQVFHNDRPTRITFKNASPGIVRFPAGEEQSATTSGGSSNFFEFDIEGVTGNRIYTVDFQWGAQAVELIEWKLPWSQVDWTPKGQP